VDGSIER